MHPIERKLRVEICPYLMTARRPSRWGPYRIYLGYSYLGELFVLLAGFGFANPVIAFLSEGQGAPKPEASGTAQTVAQFLSGSETGWIALALLLVWGLLKVYIRSEDLEKRCSLLRSCRQQCAQLEHQLRRDLAAEEPMLKLADLQTKLADLVDRNIAERSWRFNGPEPDIIDLVDAYCNELVSNFSGYWKSAPNNERA